MLPDMGWFTCVHKVIALFYVGAEAQTALHTVQQSLWYAVPRYLERLSKMLARYTGELAGNIC